MNSPSLFTQKFSNIYSPNDGLIKHETCSHTIVVWRKKLNLSMGNFLVYTY